MKDFAMAKTHISLYNASVSGQEDSAELLQESKQEGLLLLSLSRDITSCRTKKDIQQIVSDRLSKYFRFNEIMICLNNIDNLTHSNYIHTITEQTINHPAFSKGVAMKYYINDGIYNVIQQSEKPVIFDMYELMRRPNRPYYIDFFTRST